MKYALVDGDRREAQPGLKGQCRGCGAAMVAKCGERRIRAWHWAHRGTYICDPWWENESDWHRAWKNHFPEEWQEVPHCPDSGERHIADVKTQSGLVIEFQHSSLPQEERRAREHFYRSIIWVADGRRLKRGRAQFFAALKAPIIVSRQPLIAAVFLNEVALFRDWEDSRVPVYFDFGDSEPTDTLRFDVPTLWRLDPAGRNGMAYLSPVTKAEFLRVHLAGMPFEMNCTAFVARAVAIRSAERVAPPIPLPGFGRYLARQQRAKARRRF